MAPKPLSSILDGIKYPLITIKSIRLFDNNQYTFLVDPKMSKNQIKQALEFLFDVKVCKINTCVLMPKWCKRFKTQGLKRHYKKAIVKLVQGDRIDLYSLT